jgi:hypothetical protein
MDFNVTKYRKLIAIISDSIFQQVLKELSLVVFSIILKIIHTFLERLIKYFPPFTNIHFCENTFFHILSKNILQKFECGIKYGNFPVF